MREREGMINGPDIGLGFIMDLEKRLGGERLRSPNPFAPFASPAWRPLRYKKAADFNAKAVKTDRKGRKEFHSEPVACAILFSEEL
jgi:hypothetical protein